MANLVLHPNTDQAVRAAIAQKTHALLLAAPTGAGKGSVAEHIACQHLGIEDPAKLENQAYFRHLGNNGPITVENIRDLKQFLSLKTTGRADIRRVVIIENADTMNDESQNALLKSLEEPPLDTVIILCVSDMLGLRETIRSRSQIVQVLPPSKDAVEMHFKANYSAAAIAKAYLISGGLMGLMQAMLEEDSEHPLLVQIDRAKQLLGASQFDRLRQVDELAKQKPEVLLLMSALKRIASSALEQAALKDQDAAVKRWHGTLKAVSEAEANLRHNPSLKLLLTDLFMQI